MKGKEGGCKMFPTPTIKIILKNFVTPTSVFAEAKKVKIDCD